MHSVFNKALKGLSILFVLKIGLKVIDFLLNILVIRNLDQTIFGFTVHFGVLTNLILYYIKTCLKDSYQKRSIQKENLSNPEELSNMIFGIYCTIAISFIFGFTFEYMYSYNHEFFGITILLYCIACIIEAFSEPMFVSSLLNFEYGPYAKAEGCNVFFKTLSLYLLNEFHILHPLINFGVSQIIGSLFTLLIGLQTSWKTRFWPVKIKDGEKSYYVHIDMREMGIQFTIISFLKFLLQEIEKIVLITINKDPITNAEFSLVSNIGSMVPRYIYAPIEQVSFNLFAKLNQGTEKLEKNSSKLLAQIFKFINIIGIFSILFGIPYARNFLKIIYRDQWTTQVSYSLLF